MVVVVQWMMGGFRAAHRRSHSRTSSFWLGKIDGQPNCNFRKAHVSIRQHAHRKRHHKTVLELENIGGRGEGGEGWALALTLECRFHRTGQMGR